MDEPTLVYDSVDVDLLLKVLRLTFLNPLFAIWTPLLVLQQVRRSLLSPLSSAHPPSQQYSTTSPPYRVSLLYVALTFALTFLSWFSTFTRNKLWRSLPHRGTITALFGGPSLQWSDQIVVVTGGANGIGRILVETLAVLRVETVVIDRVLYEGDWDDVHSYLCDLADSKAIEEVVEKIKSEVGHPTILINNAGVVSGKLLVDLTDEDVRRTFDVNVIAHFSLIRAFLPNMIKERHGHIVTISSIFGQIGAAQLSDYCASKHALLGLHESLSAELAYHHGDPPIRTTLVLPGHVRTSLFSALVTPSRFVRFVAPTVEPHQIAKLVIAALDTEQSRWIAVPAYANIVGWLRILPEWVRDVVVWVSGANLAMREFGEKREKQGEKTSE